MFALLPWPGTEPMISLRYTHVCVHICMVHMVYTSVLDSVLFHCFKPLCNTMKSDEKKSLTCPSSSKAITTTAAPNFLIFLAFSKKSSSPSFRLMLLTMHFPWQHFNPASITAKLEESMHKGTWREKGKTSQKPSKSPQIPFQGLSSIPSFSFRETINK